MLGSVSRLLERMDEEAIAYCHWKSNWAFEETLDGETDIDILVRRSQAPAFRALLVELGYRPAVETDVSPFPSVEHYHALDPETLVIVHVHVYYRVITGGSLAKNYRLPIETMLLDNTRRIGQLAVPTAGAELIVFVVRMLVKHTGLIEPMLVRRDWKAVQDEAAWLSSDDALAEARTLLRRFLPAVDDGLFVRAFDSFGGGPGLLRRVVLGRRLRRQLGPYARHGRVHVARTNVATLAGKVVTKLRGSKKVLSPATGGAVIAFVGSEASGKTTTIEEVGRWLGKRYTVDRLHVGKPPSTAVSWLPNRLLPLLRRLVPGQRSTVVSLDRAVSGSGERKPPSLLYSLRALLLAVDRSVLLRRAHRRSANGTIVLCDRYPSADLGALDGAQLDASHPGLGALGATIARRESARYATIPPPDLVVYLTAPLETTLQRNAARSKVEDEDYVRARYAMSSSLRFEDTTVLRITTEGNLESVLRAVKTGIWDVL